MKKCPFCAEEIQDEAIKCRYCRETLVVAAESPSTAQGEPADQSSREWTGESSTDAPPVPVQPKSSTQALVEPAASTPSTTTPDAEQRTGVTNTSKAQTVASTTHPPDRWGPFHPLVWIFAAVLIVGAALMPWIKKQSEASMAAHAEFERKAGVEAAKVALKSYLVTLDGRTFEMKSDHLPSAAEARQASQWNSGGPFCGDTKGHKVQWPYYMSFGDAVRQWGVPAREVSRGTVPYPLGTLVTVTYQWADGFTCTTVKD